MRSNNISIKDARGATVHHRHRTMWRGPSSAAEIRLGSRWDGRATRPPPIPCPSPSSARSVGSTVDMEDGTIAGGQSNVTAVAPASLFYDPTAGNSTRVGTSSRNSLDLDEAEEDIKTIRRDAARLSLPDLPRRPSVHRLYNATAATVVVGTTPIFPLFFVHVCRPRPAISVRRAGPGVHGRLSAPRRELPAAPGARDQRGRFFTAWYK